MFRGIALKRVITINDISGIGKCSLTTALPIISAAGLECNPIPTAVLSTQTSDIDGFTFRDLTNDLSDYIKHWDEIGIKADAVYSGYLSSTEQISYVEKVIETFSKEGTLVLVDPAMADFGELYTGFDENFVDEMVILCKKADVITPNLTEAYYLLKTIHSEICFRTYKGFENSNDFIDYIKSICKELKNFSKRWVILTGVEISDDTMFTFIYDKENEDDLVRSISVERVPGKYYGTGDIFAAIVVSFLTRGKNMISAVSFALDFLHCAIKQTHSEGTDTRFGICFENHLYKISRYFGGTENELC